MNRKLKNIIMSIILVAMIIVMAFTIINLKNDNSMPNMENNNQNEQENNTTTGIGGASSNENTQVDEKTKKRDIKIIWNLEI